MRGVSQLCYQEIADYTAEICCVLLSLYMCLQLALLKYLFSMTFSNGMPFNSLTEAGGTLGFVQKVG